MSKTIGTLLTLALAGFALSASPQDGGDRGQSGQEKKEKDKDKKDEKAGESETPKTFVVGTTVDPKIALPDIDAKTWSFEELRGKTVVVDFWSIQCPWSKGYEAKLKALADEYSKKGVVFLAIDSNHTELADDEEDPYVHIRKYAKEAEVPYPILIDRKNVVADRFGAETTPHIYVIDAKGVVRYTGGVDDDPRGQKGDDAKRYVAEALDAVLGGREVAMKTSPPFGCTIKRIASDDPDKGKGKRKDGKKTP